MASVAPSAAPSHGAALPRAAHAPAPAGGAAPGRRRAPAPACSGAARHGNVRRRGPAPAAATPSVAPDLDSLRAAAPLLSEEELGRAVEAAFEETFWGALAAPRVLDSYRRLLRGEEFRREWPGQGLQVATSYMEGLAATPFPDISGPGYEWLLAVEAQAAAITAEFHAVTADPDLPAKGNAIWAAATAARSDAAGYGDDWRTLVLQDRGQWDDDNARLFPVTTAVFKDLRAPTLEVFFARQPSGTGIAEHTDFVNFVQTSHLGLEVPPGDACWFRVGEHVRRWQPGRAVCWDTSFMHETFNGADADRVVLIMRHWHPEVAPLERVAVSFLFDCLDAPSPRGIAAAQSAARAALGNAAHSGRARKAKGKRAKGGVKGGGAKGFGARA